MEPRPSIQEHISPPCLRCTHARTHARTHVRVAMHALPRYRASIIIRSLAHCSALHTEAFGPHRTLQVGARADQYSHSTQSQTNLLTRGALTLSLTHLLAHLGAWHTQGETMVLHMNTSLNTKEPYSQFWTRVDGGPLIAHTVAPGTPTYNVSLCDPTCTASPTHLLEVIVKSTSETIPRWVATHQASSLPLPSPCRIQLYSRTCVFSLTVVWIWNLDCVVLCMC
jgi:hypothetical protein